MADLVFGDVFGIVRVTLGKKLALKSTQKASAAEGVVSVDAGGKLVLGNGRVHTGVYGQLHAFLLNLPGLGFRLKRSYFVGPVAFAGQLVAHLELDRLSLFRVGADDLVPERELPLENPRRTLPPQKVGPEGAGEQKHRLLHTRDDGRFAAFVAGRLWAGRIGPDAVDWSVEVAVHPTVALDLFRLDDRVCLVVMDHAAGRARLLSIDDRAQISVLELDAIGLPAVTDAIVAWQPRSGLVVLRSPDGTDVSFDVSAFDTHPHPTPEAGFYLTPSVPPPPERLSGRLYAKGADVVFVPWHHETVVEIRTGRVLDRGLVPGAGPLRRGILEIVARDNAVLASLQLESGLSRFEPVPKNQSASLGVRLPECPPTLGHLAATGFATRLSDRFVLRTHGWGWSSLSHEGGAWQIAATAELDETRRLLDWMIRADQLPFESDRELQRPYTEMLGIPSDPRPEQLPLRRDAERLWLRATLETIAACGWPVRDVPEHWATEPVTPEMAIDALRGLSTWSRRRPYEGLHLVSCILVHHLDRDAQPVLVSLVADHPTPLLWKQYRDAGELLVWLCRRHPDLQPATLAAIRAVRRSDPQAVHELEVVAGALERGARHLWSNG